MGRVEARSVQVGQSWSGTVWYGAVRSGWSRQGQVLFGSLGMLWSVGVRTGKTRFVVDATVDSKEEKTDGSF